MTPEQRARENLRRAVEDGERLYRKRMHGEPTIADDNRIDGILTGELENALAEFDRLVAERDEARRLRENAERQRDNWHASNHAERRARLAAERREAELREALALAFAGHTARAQVALAAVPAADPAPPPEWTSPDPPTANPAGEPFVREIGGVG